MGDDTRGAISSSIACVTMSTSPITASYVSEVCHPLTWDSEGEGLMRYPSLTFYLNSEKAAPVIASPRYPTPLMPGHHPGAHILRFTHFNMWCGELRGAWASMGEGGAQSNAGDGISLVFRQYALSHPFKQWLPHHHTSQTVSSTSDQQKPRVAPDLHSTANT